MDREFLMNYEAKEKEELKKYFVKLHEGGVRERDKYSLGARLNLGKIYTMLAPLGNLWCQIPLYDTTVIALRPIKDKREFERVHTFDIEDIDRLIDLAKKTNRVQFVLGRSPQLYLNMDFLDPVFNELKPPYLEELRLSSLINEEKVKLWKDDFKSCVRGTDFLDYAYSHPVYNYYKHFKMSSDQAIEMASNYFSELRAFATLYDCEEYNEIADMIERESKTNPMNAFETLYAYALVIRPYRSLIKGEGYIHSEQKTFFERSARMVRKNGIFTPQIKPEFAYEVGKFLDNKLKLMSPKDREGAIKLSDEYDVYDLRRVMEALNKAVEKEKIDIINEKSKEISIIFENVWSDANKLKRKINIFRHGISFGIGVVGAVATLPIAGFVGLLVGLGFEGFEKIADIKACESISERIIKWRTQSYLTHVYDFKKKYILS